MDSVDITTVDCHPKASWFDVPATVPALVETHVSFDTSALPAYCSPDYSTFQIQAMPVRPDFVAGVPAWTQDWFTIQA